LNLKVYLSILWANMWVIILTTLVTAGVVTTFTLLTTPIYSASTTLRVASASLGSVSYTDYMTADRLMNTYTKIATSRPILYELANNLNLQSIPQVKVTTISSTELFKITVESPSPMIAKDAANGLAEILIAQSKEYYSGSGKSTQEILSEQVIQTESELSKLREEYNSLLVESPENTEQISKAADAIQLKETTYATLLQQYEQARLREALRENIISVVEPAVEPLSPAKPRKIVNISLGLVVGLIGGVALVFVLETFEARLYTADQIEIVTELVPIGKIPTFSNKGFLLAQNGNLKIRYTLFKESFRRLQSRIITQFNEKTSGKTVKTILFTSALPSEGKSTIVSNLAIAFAQNGKKTLVVDCDLRIPTQHKIIGLPNRQGLSDVLYQDTNSDDVIQKTRYNDMYLLSSGSLPQNPTELLGGSRMKILISKLTHQYDIIILDAPALLPVADTTLIAGLADGVVLVTRRAYSKEENVREACRQLGEINAHMLGVVINGVEQNGTYYYQPR